MSVQCKSCDHSCKDLNNPTVTLCYGWERPSKVNPKKQRLCRKYRRK